MVEPRQAAAGSGGAENLVKRTFAIDDGMEDLGRRKPRRQAGRLAHRRAAYRHGPRKRRGGTAAAHGPRARAAPPRPRRPATAASVTPISRARSISAAMRFSVAGWVENRLSTPWPDNGLMMNMCAVAGLRSALSFSMRSAAVAIFCRAEASQWGLPQISAPIRSAAYSRVRLIAICTSIAASGARHLISMAPMLTRGQTLQQPMYW